MTTTKDISGTYSRETLSQLLQPVAWSGAPDHGYEAAVRALVAEGREALAENPDATAVEIVEGKIVATLVDHAV